LEEQAAEDVVAAATDDRGVLAPVVREPEGDDMMAVSRPVAEMVDGEGILVDIGRFEFVVLGDRRT
jgi:hypothetical protein